MAQMAKNLAAVKETQPRPRPRPRPTQCYSIPRIYPSYEQMAVSH